MFLSVKKPKRAGVIRVLTIMAMAAKCKGTSALRSQLWHKGINCRIPLKQEALGI